MELYLGVYPSTLKKQHWSTKKCTCKNTSERCFKNEMQSLEECASLGSCVVIVVALLLAISQK